MSCMYVQMYVMAHCDACMRIVIRLVLMKTRIMVGKQPGLSTLLVSKLQYMYSCKHMYIFGTQSCCCMQSAQPGAADCQPAGRGVPVRGLGRHAQPLSPPRGLGRPRCQHTLSAHGTGLQLLTKLPMAPTTALWHLKLASVTSMMPCLWE